MTTPLESFTTLRPRLFGIAYRMLGSAHDADDVTQDVALRWHDADHAAIQSAEAWLVTVTTRLSIDRLRRATTEREMYEGQWLPEPIATPSAPDKHAELTSDLSIAFLVLLERLDPDERAAFLLREVFDAGYPEIATVLERSEAACRQLVHRARERVRRDRQRFSLPGDATARERLLQRFLDALAADDKDGVVAVLGPDASWMADGGGKVPATRRTVHGAEDVARLLLGWERKGRGILIHHIEQVNGESAIVSRVGGRVFATTSIDVVDGRIAAFYRVLNPDKLTRVGGPVTPLVARR